jgi:redox-sensing transcriptional repressor
MPGLISIPLPTLKRLPLYLELFKESGAGGDEWLSSESIARRLGLTAIQVRKDLALTFAPASPKRGFRVGETTALIGELLGANHLASVFLVGLGPRAEAACQDGNLARHGFKIIAAFDPSLEREADMIRGLKVFPLIELPGLARSLGVSLAVMTASESRYPGTVRFVAEAGIRGLVNLSGETIEEEEGLVVAQDDLGFQLTSLARELDRRNRNPR